MAAENYQRLEVHATNASDVTAEPSFSEFLRSELWPTLVDQVDRCVPNRRSRVTYVDGLCGRSIRHAFLTELPGTVNTWRGRPPP